MIHPRCILALGLSALLLAPAARADDGLEALRARAGLDAACHLHRPAPEHASLTCEGTFLDELRAALPCDALPASLTTLTWYAYDGALTCEVSPGCVCDDDPDARARIGQRSVTARKHLLAAQQVQLEGDHEKALLLAGEAVELAEESLGSAHPTTAHFYDARVSILLNLRRHDAALSDARRSAKIRAHALGPRHRATLLARGDLGALLHINGEGQQAVSLLQENLEHARAAFGDRAPETTTALSDLGRAYTATGHNAEAIALFEEALRIQRDALDEDTIEVAVTLRSLGGLYERVGRYESALPHYSDALDIATRIYGPDHPFIAAPMSALGNLYRLMGQHERALELLEDALELTREAAGPRHPQTALSLNDLALVHQARGDSEQAIALLEDAVSIARETLGDAHPDTAHYMSNLGASLQLAGQLERARQLLTETLALSRTHLGEHHPDTALAMAILADVLQALGRYDEALPLYRDALVIFTRALGDAHPYVASLLHSLVILHSAQGQFAEAWTWLEMGLSAQDAHLDALLASPEITEEQRLIYMRKYRDATTTVIAFWSETGLPGAARRALETLMQRKGRVLDAQILQLEAARRDASPEVLALLERRREAQSRHATLVLGGDGHGPEATRLREELDALEVQLARKSEGFRAQQALPTVDAVREHIPEGALLIELTRFEGVDFDAPPDARYLGPRYAAFTLDAAGRIDAFDLGPADTLEADIARTLRCLQGGPGACELRALAAASRALHGRLIEPLSEVIGDRRHLLIAPDAQLNLVPFEALLDGEGRYLLERAQISVLTSGRDLLSLQLHGAPRSPPALIAHPDYTSVAASPRWSSAEALRQHLEGVPLDDAPADRQDPLEARGGSVFEVLASTTWPPLPRTLREAASIAPRLGQDARVAIGQDAAEALLAQVHGPSILHLATHGFFLGGPPGSSGSEATRFGVALSPTAEGLQGGEEAPEEAPIDPLLRSGVVLAGANGLRGGDGVMTAREVANLDLVGTRLVVLSACETGTGAVTTGEGVHGLRRALALAGSETQVLSLWKVSDAGTQALMTRFYDGLRDGRGRGAALREAQLSMLEEDRWSHPFYWAAFVAVGDWRTLSGGDPPSPTERQVEHGEAARVSVDDLRGVASPPRAGGCACRQRTPRPAGGSGPLAALILTLVLCLRRHALP